MEITFSIISLLGGLAMFLYGMRLMGDTLKTGASGTLKNVMEKVTNNPIKAFLLGLFVTAIIQSSTATIVITSGLVAAGIFSLDQSLGIIIGANVGTTVTGQIIRLLDIDSKSNPVLQFFQPSTLAPVALIVGIILIMGFKLKKATIVGNIAIGFGILFSGLLSMKQAVSGLDLASFFTGLDNSPILAYFSGAGTAFILQSSSATIGILQALSSSGQLIFSTVAIILVGIYLGDCVTTAIVCSIGAKPDARRVGIVNILFNLSKTVLVLVVVNVAHQFGLLNGIWDMKMTSGTIANTNTVINLGCAVLLLPLVKVYGKLSRTIVKDSAKPKTTGKFAEKLNGLNPVFFNTPALAFNSCYEALKTMFDTAKDSLDKGYELLFNYDDKVFSEIEKDEDGIDLLADNISDYLVRLSKFVKEDNHIRILDEYNKIITCFERLGDHAMNIAESAQALHDAKQSFSDDAKYELKVVHELMDRILDNAGVSFKKKDVACAEHIEPLEEVMDDMINTLHDNYLERLREGKTNVAQGMLFLEILSNLERVSDICSDVGVITITRMNPTMGTLAHSYISTIHSGKDNNFYSEYEAAHKEFFDMLNEERPTDQLSFS